MLRSLFSGITGLKAHQTMMDVTSNNIANVNTTGFKSSTAIFEDTLSQMVRSSASPSTTAGLGGINPEQVGLGVQLGGISNNFGQGSAQVTNKPTDIMINGDGFFILKDGGEEVYSRAGAYNFDTNGDLVNDSGMYVMGYPATNGVPDTNAPLARIHLPTGTTTAPAPTGTVTITGNIPAANTSVITKGATAYDARGNAHSLTVTFSPNAAGNGYDVTVSDATPGATATPGSIVYSGAGAPPTVTPTSIVLADGTNVTIDDTAVTNYGGVDSMDVTKVDGYAAGSLQQFKIGPDGVVTGVFSNGQKVAMGQIALASFNNPVGLEKMGDTAFRATTNSGLPQRGIPSSAGRGSLASGQLEMSNVDLGTEFTNMIIAERGFQANSRVITSSDEMLQDLVNIKR